MDSSDGGETMRKLVGKKGFCFLFLLGTGLTVGLVGSGTTVSAATIDCSVAATGCPSPGAAVNGGNFTLGSSGNAYFITQEFNPAGTGYIAPFIRLHDSGTYDPAKGKFLGSPDGYESGVNGGNALEEKDNFIHNWNRILAVSSDMIFSSGGIDYMSFWLDMNETASEPLIDMTDLRLYVGPGNLYSQASDPNNDNNLVWGMDEYADNTVKLNYQYAGGGSGWGDLNVMIPLLGGGAQYIGQNFFLYSAFGLANNLVDDGFEEWQVEGMEQRPPDEVPEPATLLLFGTGLAWLAGVRRKMRKE